MAQKRQKYLPSITQEIGAEITKRCFNHNHNNTVYPFHVQLVHLDCQDPGSDVLSQGIGTGEKNLLIYSAVHDMITSHFTEEDVTIDARHDFLKEK